MVVSSCSDGERRHERAAESSLQKRVAIASCRNAISEQWGGGSVRAAGSRACISRRGPHSTEDVWQVRCVGRRLEPLQGWQAKRDPSASTSALRLWQAPTDLLGPEEGLVEHVLLAERVKLGLGAKRHGRERSGRCRWGT